MNWRNNRAGFSIVELMIAIVLSAILVLTAGIMLQSTQRMFNRQKAMAGLQADMRVALPSLYALARGADYAQMSLSSNGTFFAVGTTNICRANNSMVADPNGVNLLYNRGSSAMVLASGDVQSLLITLTHSTTNTLITYTLVLTNAYDSMTAGGNVYLRTFQN